MANNSVTYETSTSNTHTFSIWHITAFLIRNTSHNFSTILGAILKSKITSAKHKGVNHIQSTCWQNESWSKKVNVALFCLNSEHISSTHSFCCSAHVHEWPQNHHKNCSIWGGVQINCRRRQWHPTPVLLPGTSHGWRSLEGCTPWGRWGSDTTERLHFHFSLSCIGEGNGNPLQCSCLENPRDGGAEWATVYGVAQSWTRLKRLSSSSR